MIQLLIKEIQFIWKQILSFYVTAAVFLKLIRSEIHSLTPYSQVKALKFFYINGFSPEKHK